MIFLSGALKTLLHFGPLYFYGLLFLAYIGSRKFIRDDKNTSLFVWIVSTPLTIFIYFMWVDKRFPIPSDLYELIVYGLLSAQLGWLGAFFCLGGLLVKSKALNVIGLSISLLSVIGHSAFVVSAIISGDFS